MSCCSSASICSRPRSRSVSVGAADDVAQRRLRRPADRLRVVLHFERRLLRVVHHPEQHRVDVDRHGVGRQRLLGGEAGRDRPLIDPGRDRVDERHDPEEPGAAQADEAAEPQHDRALPLLRDARRLHQDDADDDAQRRAGLDCRSARVRQRAEQRRHASRISDRHDVDARRDRDGLRDGRATGERGATSCSFLFDASPSCGERHRRR